MVNDVFFSPQKKKSVLLMLLAFVLAFQVSFSLLQTTSRAVSRAELDALKQQQQLIEQQKAEIQEQADALNNEMNAQTQVLQVLNAKLEITNEELDNLSAQIAFYTNSIAELENELNLANLKEREQLEKFKKRVRAMEENGTISYIAVLFEASSFSDLLTRMDAIAELTQYDNDLIQSVRDAQDAAQRAKTDMEAEMAEQEKIFASYEEKQEELKTQQLDVQDVLLSLKADSAEYQMQLESVETLQSSIDAQIADMQDKLEEQERLRAEQEAAAKLAAQNSTWYADSVGTGSGQEIVDYAMTFLGVPYVYGGTSPDGFDCSGLVYYCYRHFGYSVNRTATGLSYNGTAVSSTELQPGDVIIFSERNSSSIAHCGIYIGDGQFIHAPQTGDVVKISSLSASNYARRFWGARRIAG
jgi:cell wall-associated NlpC family hydrolase